MTKMEIATFLGIGAIAFESVLTTIDDEDTIVFWENVIAAMQAAQLIVSREAVNEIQVSLGDLIKIDNTKN